ncbi:uncharacterized protein LOC131239248 [Magnolia sinica]|uniref:uncharacterized protein LOC131239248 n=1 Tax=Magnolia sinica TaxID=86752 RepID=UPI0026595DF5|nr:uncharacterized protein LOC131239248 [Magnolia sinica]
MKNKASVLLKQIVSIISSLIKAKSMALKSKTNAMKARIIIFGLLRNKKALFPEISQKIHALLGHNKRHVSSEGVDESRETDKAIFGMLRSKKFLFPEISHKFHALLGHSKRHVSSEGVDEAGDADMAIVVYNAMTNEGPPDPCYTLSVVDDIDGDSDSDDDRYPDLTHSLFDELEFDDGSKSVIDLVRDAREDGGSDFNLEDEIDHVADVFIRRMKRQMQMQKQDSLKRYNDMLDRSM